jgi:hypothetical protein
MREGILILILLMSSTLLIGCAGYDQSEISLPDEAIAAVETEEESVESASTPFIPPPRRARRYRGGEFNFLQVIKPEEPREE